MIYALGLVVFLYAIGCLWLCWQWLRIPLRPIDNIEIPPCFQLSVLIPVRNEGKNIAALLEDLSKQTLLPKHFEVIIADDASTDNTLEVIYQFQKSNRFDLQYFTLKDEPVSSPKKRAITQSIHRAKGELIITTDGDCRVGEQWLETIVQVYLQTGAKMLSGPVTFLDNPTPRKIQHQLFAIFQTIEFASLIGTGACLMEAGHPTMCNGANLAYQRAAFEAVGGYEGVDQIASGDDEFLLQKINHRFPNATCFLKNEEAIVQTHSQPTWRAFYQQRVRWASKWAVNWRIATITVAVFVFLVNFLTLVIWQELIRTKMQDIIWWAFLSLKLLPEFVFLALIVKFLGKIKWVIFIPLVQFFYPLYVLFFGIAAQRKGYEWKGRKLR